MEGIEEIDDVPHFQPTRPDLVQAPKLREIVLIDIFNQKPQLIRNLGALRVLDIEGVKNGSYLKL